MDLTELVQKSLEFSLVIHSLTVVAVGARVIMLRRPPGVAFAWLFLVVILPVAGVLLYLFIGERRIGPLRSRRIDSLFHRTRDLVNEPLCARVCDVDWSRYPRAARGLDRLGRNLTGSFTVCGSSIELYSDTEKILAAIARDVDRAETSVLMAFYIWAQGGAADEVLEAVIRAAGRGVPAVCSSTRWAPGHGGAAGNRNDFAIPAFKCSPPYPWDWSEACSAATTCVCIARSSSSMTMSPGPAA